MSHYKRNAEANRDALFGSASVAPRSTGKSAPARSKGISTGSAPSKEANIRINRDITGNSGSSHRITSTLSGEAKMQKMQEAEKYREKAKKALERGMFSKSDPIAGGMFYHRAAEVYKVCGENRLERLHRVASGDCQMGHGAHASAASEYIRAAELSECSEETVERKRKECHKLYADAANAWKETGELGRAGEALFKSAFSLLIGVNKGDEIGGKRLEGMDKKALTAAEGAIESFVPDPLNRYRHFRKTGVSAYVDPEADDQDGTKEEETADLCKTNLITSSYAHETLFQATYKLAEWGEYESALYGCGAVSTVLESDDYVTISLSRAYCIETILTLAVGDVVAADNFFLQAHLQKNSYLTSRECKLSEDLIRAIKMRDIDALEEARSTSGSNRAALANLDSSLKQVVAGLRVTGVAKSSATSIPSSQGLMLSVNDERKPNLSEDNRQKETDTNFAEMDDLMNDMGLGSAVDDDIDLR